jgi:hypothetical protein
VLLLVALPNVNSPNFTATRARASRADLPYGWNMSVLVRYLWEADRILEPRLSFSRTSYSENCYCFDAVWTLETNA